MFNRIERDAENKSERSPAAAATARIRKVRTSLGRLRRMAPMMILLAIVLLSAPASADRYDDSEAGHPLRIVAYIVHPVGVVLDYLILRPGHWFVSQEPMRTLFGHED